LSAIGHDLPRAAIDAKLISLIVTFSVALAVFSSGFVMREPSPYELLLVPMMGVWALCGMRLTPYPAILLAIFIVYNVGGFISMTQLAELYDAPKYLAVSLFLAFTAVFFAAACEARPDLLKVIFLAWIAGALGTGILGIIGYFGLVPGAQIFTLYDRASGAFKDPNVFGPYLVLPAIYLLFRLLTGNPLKMLPHLGALLVITAAIFVSFSRGAWGLFAFSAIFMVSILFLHSASTLFRLRLAVMALLAFTALAAAILIVLQIPGVGEFFAMRAQLVQDYDGGQLGRFARYGIGFQLAMERPLGIGTLMFGRIYGEDTHNIWLKALMDYSWLGFAAFVTLIAMTVVGGFRLLFRDRPWQPFLMCAYTVFIGHILLGTIIDMDHWRHFYLLIALIWAAMALERRHQLGLLER
jgi:O-antigen ligase